MNITINYDFEKALEAYIESLQISPSRYEQASKRYESIGNWLNRDNSQIKDLNPKIYTQGSFRLGTVIKPDSDKEHYDLDLVCEIEITKDQITQKSLKEKVGKELEQYVKSQNFDNPIESGRRCWKINYTDEARFHIDVLPSIPELDINYRKQLLMNYGVQERFSESAICITDNTCSNYGLISHDWNHSNPKGYSEWFKEQMKEQFNRSALDVMKKKNQYLSVEQVPVHEVKTKLQKSIQFLKRHRDIMFENDCDNKPTSIIITTLAAQYYNGEETIQETLFSISKSLSELVVNYPDGFELRNPIRPKENFTDRWQNDPVKKKNFYKWVDSLRSDINSAAEQNNLDSMIARLGKSLGINTFRKVQSKYLTVNETPQKISDTGNSSPWASL